MTSVTLEHVMVLEHLHMRLCKLELDAMQRKSPSTLRIGAPLPDLNSLEYPSSDLDKAFYERHAKDTVSGYSSEVRENAEFYKNEFDEKIRTRISVWKRCNGDEKLFWKVSNVLDIVRYMQTAKEHKNDDWMHHLEELWSEFQPELKKLAFESYVDGMDKNPDEVYCPE